MKAQNVGVTLSVQTLYPSLFNSSLKTPKSFRTRLDSVVDFTRGFDTVLSDNQSPLQGRLKKKLKNSLNWIPVN